MTQVFEPMYFTPHPTTELSTRFLVVPPPQRTVAGPDGQFHIALPAGVNSISVSWMGDRDVEMLHRGHGAPTPAGIRTVKKGAPVFVTIPARTSGEVITFRLPTNATAADVSHTLAVTIIPGPPVGAGGGSLRKVLGAAQRLVAGWAK